MAKQLTIKNGKEKYTLEFTRESAAAIESSGFVIEDLTAKPNVMIPLLVNGAFLAHHKSVSAETVQNMYAGVKDKKGLIGRLVAMYTETVTTLIEDNDQGNVSWEPNW